MDSRVGTGRMRGVSNCTCWAGFGRFIIGWFCVPLVHRLFEWSTGAGTPLHFEEVVLVAG